MDQEVLVGVGDRSVETRKKILHVCRISSIYSDTFHPYLFLLLFISPLSGTGTVDKKFSTEEGDRGVPSNASPFRIPSMTSGS